MPFFDSAGVPIHYEVFGDGRPLVLVHGFASSLQGNWVAPGWVETLRPVRRVVALDCRGHGESGKPHDPQAYAGFAMTDDALRLMDHLGIEQADLFGYSMGGRISIDLMLDHPQRFTSVVLGGVGGGRRLQRSGPAIAQGLLAEDASTVTDEVAKGFRVFAERTGNDLKALAALRQGMRPRRDRSELARVTLPVLIVTGEQDTLVGSAEPLAKAIPGARLLTIPERDHLTVVGDARFKDAVVAFLNEA